MKIKLQNKFLIGSILLSVLLVSSSSVFAHERNYRDRHGGIVKYIIVQPDEQNHYNLGSFSNRHHRKFYRVHQRKLYKNRPYSLRKRIESHGRLHKDRNRKTAGITLSTNF
jgi:hypothetical protein